MTWITAHEAVELTGVRMQTLYAYVSRGKIRSRQDGADSRRSLYHRDDVARMAGRQRGQRNAATVAAAPWNGAIRSCRPPSRRCGMAACVPGRRCRRAGPRESVGRCRGRPGESGDASVDLAAVPAGAAPPPGEAGAIQPGIVAMAGRCVADLPTQGRSLGALRAEARGVLATLVVSMFGSQALLAGGSISQQLAAAWKRPRAEPAIRQALCLLADHELNASTFATRVTISTGASLSAGILSGLATTGPLHGRAAMSLKPLIDAMAHADAEALVRERLHTAWAFPPLGIPCIPPEIRAPPRCWKAWPCQACMPIWPCRSSAWRGAAEHRFRTGGAERRAPSALACPLALFAIGRCVGWLAHALEQAGSGRMIRPRARYVGVSRLSRHPSHRRSGTSPGGTGKAGPDRARGTGNPGTQRRHVTLEPSSSNRSLIS